MTTSDRSTKGSAADEREQHSSAAPKPVATEKAEPGIQTVLDAVARLTFGTITITMHASKIVQVDVTEKTRFSNP